jgi:hypothetical protein
MSDVEIIASGNDPDPVFVGGDERFWAEWVGDEPVSFVVCNQSGLIGQNCQFGEWCSLRGVSGVHPVECNYTTVPQDFGLRSYAMYLCNGMGCYGPVLGQFLVDAVTCGPGCYGEVSVPGDCADPLGLSCCCSGVPYNTWNPVIVYN